jgi:hypothetical protein
MVERTFNFADETISVENLDDGSHVVKVAPDGTKILAYIEDGKLARYAAEDSKGNRKPLVVIIQESSDLPGDTSFNPIIPGKSGSGCNLCYFDESAGTVVCYGTVECPPNVGPVKMGPHIP